MKLQEKIRDCRRKAGLSQEELAAKIGVSRQAVSKWETGEAEPELAKLRLLAETFGVTADYLLSEAEPPQGGMPGASDAGRMQTDSTGVEKVPGVLGRIMRKYGWLFGVYLAVTGAVVAGMGILARSLVHGMMASFTNNPFFADMNIVRHNPVSVMGGVFVVCGTVLLVCGVILAVVLKKRGRR